MDKDFETLIEAISAIRFFERFYGSGSGAMEQSAAVIDILKKMDESREKPGLLSAVAEGLEKALWAPERAAMEPGELL